MHYPWSKHTALLESSEILLQAGAELSSADTAINEKQWHADAIQLSAMTPPEDLSGAAFTLLEDIPYRDIIEAIEAVRTDRKNTDAMWRIKKGRKLFFMARDIIILTSEGEPASAFTSLVDTCRHVGTIADTRGKKGKKKSIASILELQANPPYPQPLKSQEELQLEVTRRLHIADQDIASTTFRDFHTARKDFRRVAALGVMGVAALGFSGYFEFAVEGVALSHRHGNVKDSIAKEQL